MVQSIAPENLAPNRHILNPTKHCFVLLEKCEYWLVHNPCAATSILWITSPAFTSLQNACKIASRNTGVPPLKEYVNRSYRYLTRYNLCWVRDHVPFVFASNKLLPIEDATSGRIVVLLYAEANELYIDIYTSVETHSMPTDHVCLRCKRRELIRRRAKCVYCEPTDYVNTAICPWKHDSLEDSFVLFTCVCHPLLIALEKPVFGILYPMKNYLLEYATPRTPNSICPRYIESPK